MRRHGPTALYYKNWYYSVELAPGQITKGQYDPGLPMVPRQLARRVDVAGMECLDLGSVEGLMPALLARRERHVSSRLTSLGSVPTRWSR